MTARGKDEGRKGVGDTGSARVGGEGEAVAVDSLRRGRREREKCGEWMVGSRLVEDAEARSACAQTLNDEAHSLISEDGLEETQTCGPERG